MGVMKHRNDLIEYLKETIVEYPTDFETFTGIDMSDTVLEVLVDMDDEDLERTLMNYDTIYDSLAEFDEDHEYEPGRDDEEWSPVPR
jgi:hypothetical protein